MQNPETRAQLLTLMKRKDELETLIAAYSGGQGEAQQNQPLVDSEGFPRADLDVHNVRIARHTLATLQTDHLEVMKQIEKLMFNK
jgi:26S proteasome non-ATPase regulatory subunit 9